jgi:hypothetical protein
MAISIFDRIIPFIISTFGHGTQILHKTFCTGYMIGLKLFEKNPFSFSNIHGLLCQTRSTEDQAEILELERIITEKLGFVFFSKHVMSFPNSKAKFAKLENNFF